MDQERPPPPEHLKPWYYQYWFFYPVIVFWPLWPILIIRSPWHNGLVSGALAWAYLICGGYLFGYMDIYPAGFDAGELNQFTITIVPAGIILTLVTQALWIFRDRPGIRAAMRAPQDPGAGVERVESSEPSENVSARRGSSRSRRRGADRPRRRR